MKTKIFALLTLLAVQVQVWAESNPARQIVTVYKTDGTTEKYSVADIKGMNFSPNPDADNFCSVDLGLSVDWADVNMDLSRQSLCADKPESPGGYYGWGDPTGLHHEQPETDKSIPYEEDKEICLSYYGGMIPLKDICGTEYDIAHVQWGGDWRLPSRSEQDELRLKCTWKMETLNSQKGYRVTGPSGKSIFLPAGGFRHGNGIYFSGDWMGYYWSGTLNPNEGFSQYAYSLDFTDEYYEWFSDSRYYGQSVRPVRSKANVLIEKDNGEKISIPLNQIAKITIEDFSIDPDYYEAVDLGLSVKWAAVNVDIDQFDYAAPSREIAGGYYGWGDETGKNISEDENDYLSYAGQVSISGTEHDLIRKYWGDPWRLPTMEEVQELCSECTWTWTNVNDQPGYMVIGPSGKSIFLPAVGWRTGETLKNVGTHGYYWSGTNISSNYVYQLGFNQKYFWEYTYRYNGFQLRGVR